MRQLTHLVLGLTSALEDRFEPVIRSLENKNLIDIDMWERLKEIAQEIKQDKSDNQEG